MGVIVVAERLEGKIEEFKGDEMLLHRRNGEDIHVEKSSTSTSTVIVILVMYLCTSSILAWCFGVIHDESAARSQSKIGGDFIVGTHDCADGSVCAYVHIYVGKFRRPVNP